MTVSLDDEVVCEPTTMSRSAERSPTTRLSFRDSTNDGSYSRYERRFVPFQNDGAASLPPAMNFHRCCLDEETTRARAGGVTR